MDVGGEAKNVWCYGSIKEYARLKTMM